MQSFEYALEDELDRHWFMVQFKLVNALGWLSPNWWSCYYCAQV